MLLVLVVPVELTLVNGMNTEFLSVKNMTKTSDVNLVNGMLNLKPPTMLEAILMN